MTMQYKFYYVTRPSRINQSLKCYGSHATLQGAIADCVNRAREYGQSTEIHGIDGGNQAHKINAVTA